MTVESKWKATGKTSFLGLGLGTHYCATKQNEQTISNNSIGAILVAWMSRIVFKNDGFSPFSGLLSPFAVRIQVTCKCHAVYNFGSCTGSGLPGPLIKVADDVSLFICAGDTANQRRSQKLLGNGSHQSLPPEARSLRC